MTENDRVIQNLKTLGEIDACPQSTKRAAKHIRLALSARPASPPSFNRRMRASAPVTIVVVVLAGITIYLPWPISDSTNIVFAEVKQQVQKTRTVQYISTRFHKVLPETRPWIGKEEVSRVRILGRYRRRIEKEDAQGNVYHVDLFDAKSGMQVSIDPINKVFAVFEQQVTIDVDTGSRTESTAEPNLDADLFKSIHRIPDDVEELPPAKVDGRTAARFREIRKQGPVTWTRTIWADPKTKLPVRVEVKSRSTDPRIGPAHWVLSDFTFDAELDASLFSTEPPVGYSVERKVLFSIAPPE